MKKRKPVDPRVMDMDAVRNFTFLEGLGTHRWCAAHGVFHNVKGHFEPHMLAAPPERRHCKVFADEAACLRFFEDKQTSWSTEISLFQLRFFMEDPAYIRTNVPGLNIEMHVLATQHQEGCYRYVRQAGQKDCIIRISGAVPDRGQVLYDHLIVDGQVKYLCVPHTKFHELIVDHDFVTSEFRAAVQNEDINVKHGDPMRRIPMPFIYYIMERAFRRNDDGSIDWPNGVHDNCDGETKIRGLIASIYNDNMARRTTPTDELINEDDMRLWLSTWDSTSAVDHGYVTKEFLLSRRTTGGASSSNL